MRQPASLELLDESEEFWDQFLPAGFGRTGLLSKEFVEVLLEVIDSSGFGVFSQVVTKPFDLLGLQSLWMPTHQRDQPAVLAGHRIKLSPGGHEVVADEANHMESIGNDLRFGEVLTDH